MADIKDPEDSLSSYFDELLGDQEEQQSLPQLLGSQVAGSQLSGSQLGGSQVGGSQMAGSQVAAGAARVVVMPSKVTANSRLETKKLNLVPSPQTLPEAVRPKPTEPQAAEPEFKQSEEQKLKLERMLQAARTQLLMEAKPKEALQTLVEVREQLQVSSKFEVRSNEIQEWDIEAPVVEVEVPPELIEPLTVAEPAIQAQTQGFQMEGLEWLENGRPQWAQNRFDVLLFNVAGLTLAVPLIALGQIQPLTDELTPLFGQADWFMGLQPTAAGKIRTVNTAKFVMPERYDENFVNTAKYVVSINGVPWGLAVDSVNQPITLQPEDVKWRSDRSKRPWLAGTVKEHMCALLDIPRIGQMLVDADRNFRPT